MSERIEVKGRCGKLLDAKVWKQGGSVKCKERGWSIVCYPKPTPIQISQDVIEICEGCESIESQQLEVKQ